MFSIAPKLTLYTIIPLPILSIMIFKLSQIINIKSRKVQEILSDLSSFTQENFNGISIIKSYNLIYNTNLKEYYKKMFPWKNTEEQRKLMMTYQYNPADPC